MVVQNTPPVNPDRHTCTPTDRTDSIPLAADVEGKEVHLPEQASSACPVLNWDVCQPLKGVVQFSGPN